MNVVKADAVVVPPTVVEDATPDVVVVLKRDCNLFSGTKERGTFENSLGVKVVFAVAVEGAGVVLSFLFTV